ncbi:MAG: hypothetical protein K0Q99_2344 [Clostridia bacterium]|jgi:hypothetical protein|nr:hypothetical protein [Clostridia bacterium]
MHFILIIASIIIAFKWGDWRNWRKYYSTILYFGFFDLIVNSVYHNMSLWIHKSTLSIYIPHTIIGFTWIFIIYPAIVLVYLFHVPRDVKGKILYVIKWVVCFTIIECILYLVKGIEYHNNWTLFSSMLFNIGMFTILLVHHYKPMTAWLITFIMAIIFMLIYRIPLSLIK